VEAAAPMEIEVRLDPLLLIGRGLWTTNQPSIASLKEEIAEMDFLEHSDP